MVANNAAMSQRRLDDLNLTIARRGLNADLAPDLHAAERAVRVEAYRLQVALAGQIVDWLPPAASQHMRNHRSLVVWKRGRQWRWFHLR